MTCLAFSKRGILAAAVALGMSGPGPLADIAAAQEPAKATILLVHGAFEDSSSWSGVVPGLERAGYNVISAANPLRSLKGDAAYVSDLVKSLHGPVVLVGHSYGGSVITDAAAGNDNVRALVYVAALAPDAGESALDLVGKFPGSTLGVALKPPVALSGGAHDLYVQPEKFSGSLAADVPAANVELLVASQRPVTDAALTESSGAPAWRTVPAWFIYGAADMSIPAEAHQFMADRARARKVVVVKGASHLVMVSHPGTVERFIEDAVAGSKAGASSTSQ